MNLKEYMKDKEIATEGQGLPEGETVIHLNETEVTEKSISYPDGPKTKYLLKYKGIEYIVPATVMKGLKKVMVEGKETAKIIRSGKMKADTKYIVLGV